MLSVVIPALNSESTLGLTLSTVFSNDLSREEFEVIVVDNGSSDKTLEVARSYPVKIFYCAKRGQGAARNLGVANAKGEIICLTDSDVMVPKKWLREISDFFNTHTNVDGVGGPILPPRSGHANKLQKLEGELFVKTHDFPAEITESKFRDKRSCIYTANCAFRKEVFLSFNGFDDSGMDAIDVDLCWRLILAGKSCVFNPEIKVIHLGWPSSLRGVFKQQSRWGDSQARLDKKFPVQTSFGKRLLPYYFFLTLLIATFKPKRRTESLLQFFENCAFNFGYVNSFLKL